MVLKFLKIVVVLFGTAAVLFEADQIGFARSLFVFSITLGYDYLVTAARSYEHKKTHILLQSMNFILGVAGVAVCTAACIHALGIAFKFVDLDLAADVFCIKSTGKILVHFEYTLSAQWLVAFIGLAVGEFVIEALAIIGKHFGLQSSVISK